MLLTTDDMCHAHQLIVHDNCEVIGRESIGLANDEVFQFARFDPHFAENRILYHDRGIARDLEPNHKRPPLGNPRGHGVRIQIEGCAVIPVGSFFLSRRTASLGEFLGRLECAVRVAGINQLSQVLLVDVESI